MKPEKYQAALPELRTLLRLADSLPRAELDLKLVALERQWELDRLEEPDSLRRLRLQVDEASRYDTAATPAAVQLQPVDSADAASLSRLASVRLQGDAAMGVGPGFGDGTVSVVDGALAFPGQLADLTPEQAQDRARALLLAVRTLVDEPKSPSATPPREAAESLANYYPALRVAKALWEAVPALRPALAEVVRSLSAPEDLARLAAQLVGFRLQDKLPLEPLGQPSEAGVVTPISTRAKFDLGMVEKAAPLVNRYDSAAVEKKASSGLGANSAEREGWYNDFVGGRPEALIASDLVLRDEFPWQVRETLDRFGGNPDVFSFYARYAEVGATYNGTNRSIVPRYLDESLVAADVTAASLPKLLRMAAAAGRAPESLRVTEDGAKVPLFRAKCFLAALAATPASIRLALQGVLAQPDEAQRASALVALLTSRPAVEFGTLVAELVKLRQETGRPLLSFSDSRAVGELLDTVGREFVEPESAAVVLCCLGPVEEFHLERMLQSSPSTEDSEREWSHNVRESLAAFEGDALAFALADVQLHSTEPDFEALTVRSVLAAGRTPDDEWGDVARSNPVATARALLDQALRFPAGSPRSDAALSRLVRWAEAGVVGLADVEAVLTPPARRAVEDWVGRALDGALEAFLSAPDSEKGAQAQQLAELMAPFARLLQLDGVVTTLFDRLAESSRERVLPLGDVAALPDAPGSVVREVVKQTQLAIAAAVMENPGADLAQVRAQALRETLAGLRSRLGALVELPMFAELLDEASWNGRLSVRLNLASLETFEPLPTFDVDTVTGSNDADTATRRAAISKLARVAPPATSEELVALSRMLEALSTPTLDRLMRAGYTVVVARHDVSALAPNARGLVGAHRADNKTLVLRSYVRDGKVQLDPQHLLEQVGRFHDTVSWAQSGKPACTQPAFSEAIAHELPLLPGLSQEDFFSRTFSYYLLDPARFEQRFPEMFKAFEAKLKGEPMEQRGLQYQQMAMVADPLVRGEPDAVELIRGLESANSDRVQRSLQRLPYVVTLTGDEPALARQLAETMAAAVVFHRSKGCAWGQDDNLVAIDAATFNSPEVLRSLLASRKTDSGSVLYLGELGAILPSSPGWAVLKEYFAEVGGRAPVVMAGSKAELRALEGVLDGGPGPTATRRNVEVPRLAAAGLVEQVVRDARLEGISVSTEARAALLEKYQGGTRTFSVAEAHEVWGRLKESLVARNARLRSANVPGAQDNVGLMVSADVRRALGAMRTERSAYEEMDAMIGLSEAKSRVHEVVDAMVTQARKIAAGMSLANATNTNIVFAGDPGTGKTEMAKHVARALYEGGVTTKGEPVYEKAANFKDGNAAAKMAKLFADNKGRVIFIDEAHQLSKEVLEAMIPFMADKDYIDTPVILAGYSEELVEMLQQDRGGQSRVEVVNFRSYTHAELGLILDKKIADGGLEVAPQVRRAMLDAVQRRQRTMITPDNGRSVEKVLAATIRAQEVRIARTHAPDSALRTLLLEDVPKPPDVRPASVIEKVSAAGLDELASVLWGLDGVIALNKEAGHDWLEGVPTNFVFTAENADRRAEVLGLLSEFLYAEGLLSEADFVANSGNAFQGGYIGNSTELAVRGLYDKLQGKLMVIEQPTAMTGLGTFEKQATATLQKILASNRQFTAFFDTRAELGTFFDGHPELLDERYVHPPLVIEGKPPVRSAELLGLLATLAVPVDQASQAALETALGQAEGAVDFKKLSLALRNAYASRAALGDRSALNAQDVEAALQSYRRQAAAFGSLRSAARPSPAQSQLPVEAQGRRDTASPTRVEQATLQLDRLEASFRAAQRAVDLDPAFKRLFDTGEIVAQERSADSEYVRAIAKRMNVTPKRAFAVMQRIKQKVLTQRDVVIRKFQYHCPHCGGVDSPTCWYMKNCTVEWRMEHSLQPPWEERITVTDVQEVEVDERRTSS